jgi:Protein of unknown function (DUF3099)
VSRDRRSVLITDVAENPEKELRRREIRYVAMMMVRALCLVGGAIIVSTKPPLWGLWLSLCVVGMVVIPWLAVILANDRPARSRAERARGSQPIVADRAALPAPPQARVIDAD